MNRRKALVTFALLLMTIVPVSCSSGAAAQVFVTATPSPAPPPGPQVTLYYEGYAQFELISPEGRRLLIDVHDPARLSAPVTDQDVLLSTHLHGDHFVESFADSFPGPEIRARVDELILPEVTIRSIASAHSPNETPVPEGGSNYIYVIDIADMRIAHFGDIGQEELSDEQLDALGDVDVAILLFGGMCSVSEMGSFPLMEQVQPKLIIPTHASPNALAHALELWQGYWVDPGDNPYEDIPPVMIGNDDLPDETGFLPLGEWSTTCRGLSDLVVW